MKNSIIESIKTMFEMLIISIQPETEKTYALVYVKSDNRVIR